MSLGLQQETLSVSQISKRQTQSHFSGDRLLQNPITLSFQTSVSHRLYLHKLGEQARPLFRDWKNMLHFSSFSGVSWAGKEEEIHSELLLLLVFRHFRRVSSWPSPLFQFKHLHSCHLLEWHLRHSCPWVGYNKCNGHRCVCRSVHQKQDTKPTFNATLVHVHIHSLIQASHKWALILVEFLRKELYVINVWDCQSLSGWGAVGIVAPLWHLKVMEKWDLTPFSLNHLILVRYLFECACLFLRICVCAYILIWLKLLSHHITGAP